MFRTLIAAWCLVALTVMIHALGLALLLRRTLRAPTRLDTRFWPVMWLLVHVAGWLILIHLGEITVWALFFWWRKCLPDMESSLYFSGSTYATVGYGDLVLPKGWRLLGPVEGLTGILMCGLSIGFFFAVVNKVFGARSEVERN